MGAGDNRCRERVHRRHGGARAPGRCETDSGAVHDDRRTAQRSDPECRARLDSRGGRRRAGDGRTWRRDRDDRDRDYRRSHTSLVPDPAAEFFSRQRDTPRGLGARQAFAAFQFTVPLQHEQGPRTCRDTGFSRGAFICATSFAIRVDRPVLREARPLQPLVGGG